MTTHKNIKITIEHILAETKKDMKIHYRFYYPIGYVSDLKGNKTALDGNKHKGKVAMVSYADTEIKPQTIIRSVYRGLPVKAINDSAFIFHSLASVYIPDSICYMGLDSFHNCRFLETISLPDTLVWIRFRCFADDVRLSNVEIRLNNSDDWLSTVITIFRTLDN